MKKITKKLLSAVFVLFAFMVMYPAFSVKADAFSLQDAKKVTVTYYSKNDVSSKKTRNELNKYLLSIETGEKVSLTSSDTSVLTVSKTELTVDSGDIRTDVFVTVKKPGTATVFCKQGSKTYKTKVVVKKYTSPVTYVRINKSKIAGSKFRLTSSPGFVLGDSFSGTEFFADFSKSTYKVSYSKYAGKKPNMGVKVAKGWELIYMNTCTVKGKSSNILDSKTPLVKGGAGFTVNMTLVEKATGRRQMLSLVFK